MGRSYGEQETNGCGFHNWAKCFRVIDPRALMEPFCNKASFVFVNGVIRIVFDPKYPFAPNNVMSINWGNKGPCLVTGESLIFFKHGISPVRN